MLSVNSITQIQNNAPFYVKHPLGTTLCSATATFALSMILGLETDICPGENTPEPSHDRTVWAGCFIGMTIGGTLLALGITAKAISVAQKRFAKKYDVDSRTLDLLLETGGD